jgi:hypothetical protein
VVRSPSLAGQKLDNILLLLSNHIVAVFSSTWRFFLLADLMSELLMALLMMFINILSKLCYNPFKIELVDNEIAVIVMSMNRQLSFKSSGHLWVSLHH